MAPAKLVRGLATWTIGRGNAIANSSTGTERRSPTRASCPPGRPVDSLRSASSSSPSSSSSDPSDPTTVPQTSTTQTSPYTHYAVTLTRSLIGVPHPIAALAHRLNLRRRMKTVYLPIQPSVAGQILKLKEIVKVENVSYVPTNREVNEARKFRKGYTVVGKMVGTMRTYAPQPLTLIRPDPRHYETDYEASFMDKKPVVPMEERRFMPKAGCNSEPVDLAALDAEIATALKRLVASSFKSTYGESYGKRGPHTTSLSRHCYTDQTHLNPSLIDPTPFRRRHRVSIDGGTVPGNIPVPREVTSTFVRDFLRPETGVKVAKGSYGTTYGAQFGERSLKLEVGAKMQPQQQHGRATPNNSEWGETEDGEVESGGDRMEYRTVVQKAFKYRK
ncbi:39S ribosomal protein L33, mitochondrial [Gonapodya sp. JEL0774]|nr:39S ribosomal protein L33, mitochondrial [Gonapodya sp. JEL0774]